AADLRRGGGVLREEDRVGGGARRVAAVRHELEGAPGGETVTLDGLARARDARAELEVERRIPGDRAGVLGLDRGEERLVDVDRVVVDVVVVPGVELRDRGDAADADLHG